MRLFGFLNLDKRPGMTSRGAVNLVQRLVRPAKVGHAGTLDPLASGVLLVCVGPATRLTEYAHRLPKRYRAEFLLGRRSPTDDVEVDADLLPDAPVPSREQIESALPNFVGQIEQRPPAFSAVKIKGRRAYELARRGKEVEPPPRTVTIHALNLVEFDYPKLVLDVECGSGTYIRALGRDLADSLGTAAVMSGLERTAIGPFKVDAALDVDWLTAGTLESHLQPPQSVLIDLPQLQLTIAEFEEIKNGRPIERQVAGQGEEFAALDEAGRLVSILVLRDGRSWPRLNFGS